LGFVNMPNPPESNTIIIVWEIRVDLKAGLHLMLVVDIPVFLPATLRLPLLPTCLTIQSQLYSFPSVPPAFFGKAHNNPTDSLIPSRPRTGIPSAPPLSRHLSPHPDFGPASPLSRHLSPPHRLWTGISPVPPPVPPTPTLDRHLPCPATCPATCPPHTDFEPASPLSRHLSNRHPPKQKSSRQAGGLYS
jgi:hypothetical protein